jgi:hypothetical protein
VDLLTTNTIFISAILGFQIARIAPKVRFSAHFTTATRTKPFLVGTCKTGDVDGTCSDQMTLISYVKSLCDEISQLEAQLASQGAPLSM